MMWAVRKKATKEFVRWMYEDDEAWLLPAEDEEPVETVYASFEEAHQDYLLGGEMPANIILEDDGTATGVARGDEHLDQMQFLVLLALLRFGKFKNKANTAPVTYGDVREIAGYIRKRQIALTDDGSVR